MEELTINGIAQRSKLKTREILFALRIAKNDIKIKASKDERLIE